MEKEKMQKLIDERIKKLVPELMRGSMFTEDKYADTPTDAYSVVPRNYVNLNGVSASRPTSSIVGQFYFDTTLGKPIWWDGTKFVLADGTTA